MSDWRDDLPPIPADRIRSDAIREGHRRLQQRRERRLAALYGGIGTVAVVLVVVAALAIRPGADGDDDAASATTAGGRDRRRRRDRAAPQATDASRRRRRGATRRGDHGGHRRRLGDDRGGGGVRDDDGPAHDGRRTDRGAPAERGRAHGPGDDLGAAGRRAGLWPVRARLSRTSRGRLPMDDPIVHWETAGVDGESPMTVAGDVATATVGPFAADTLSTGAVHEVLVWVTDASEVSARRRRLARTDRGPPRLLAVAPTCVLSHMSHNHSPADGHGEPDTSSGR